MNNFLKEETVKKMLFLFIIIQPLMDIYYLYTIPNLGGVFVFSPSTIIRFVFFGILCLFAFLILKKKNKFKLLWWFICIVLIYTLFHHLNCLNYNNEILGNQTYSLITELFYIARMLMPILLIYISYNFKLSEKKLSKALFITAAIFSFTMVITNLFLIAIPSYDGATNIKVNFLQWFSLKNQNIEFIYIASKGIFHMANQISGTFVLILPLLIYYFNKKHTFLRFIIICSLILSMLMLGTRVASYGAIIICIAMFVMYLFFYILKKEYNINKKVIVSNFFLIIFSIVFFCFSPVVYRNFTSTIPSDDSYSKEQTIIKKYNTLLKENNKKELIKFIKENSLIFSIREKYTNEVYPAENNLNFWINTFNLPIEKRNDDRKIQQLILEDVFNRNNSIFDVFCGIGSSRVRNSSIYIEKDFIVHYYMLGVFGLFVFISPYVIILCYSVFKVLRRNKQTFNYKNCTFIFATFLTLICSIYSGNVLDELIITVYLGIVLGTLLSNINNNSSKQKLEDNKLKLSVIVPVYNVENYLETCLDSLINQTITNYEIIVVNDGSLDSSQSIIDKYQKLYPDKIKSYIKENGGLSDARNYGLKYAKGEYIAFLDSDDYVEYNMYELMYNKAVSQNFDVVACNVKYVYENENKTFLCNSKIYSDLFEEKEIKKLMLDIYPAVWNKIYKREKFQKFKFKKNAWFEDVEYLYRIFPYISSMGTIDKALINYKQREGAITKTFDERLLHQISNWNGIVEYYKKNNLLEKYEKEIEYCYVRYLYATLVSHSLNYNNYDFFKKVLDECDKNVKENFPNYRKNKYLYTNGLKGLYLLFYNKKIIKKLYKYKHKNGGNK
ncbi:MAG: O-antigen ligase family protein [Bacilli bacterium]|nr:O-antigen ligase family protein [Bacilli bacterium]